MHLLLAVVIGIPSLLFLINSLNRREVSDALMATYLLASAVYIASGGIPDSLALLCVMSTLFAYMTFAATSLGTLRGYSSGWAVIVALVYSLVIYLVSANLLVALSLSILLMPYLVAVSLIQKISVRVVLSIIPLFYLLLPDDLLPALIIASSVISVTLGIIYYLPQRRMSLSSTSVPPSREAKRKSLHVIFAMVFILALFGISLPLDIVETALKTFYITILGHEPWLTGLRLLVIILCAGLLPVVMTFEVLRIKKGIEVYPPHLLRSKEREGLATYVYSLVSAFIVALFFTDEIFVAAIVTALVADAASAIVGIKYGRRFITKNRSLEGTLAGLIVAFITLLVITGGLVKSLIIAGLIEAIDVANSKLDVDDNLLFPIIIATLLEFLVW